jgi:hypothetical protein
MSNTETQQVNVCGVVNLITYLEYIINRTFNVIFFDKL